MVGYKYFKLVKDCSFRLILESKHIRYCLPMELLLYFWPVDLAIGEQVASRPEPIAISHNIPALPVPGLAVPDPYKQARIPMVNLPQDGQPALVLSLRPLQLAHVPQCWHRGAVRHLFLGVLHVAELMRDHLVGHQGRPDQMQGVFPCVRNVQY